MRYQPSRKLLPLLLTMAVVGCGGGGGGGGSSAAGSTTDTPANAATPAANTATPNWPAAGPAPGAVGGTMTLSMTCVDGPDYQCSGASVLRTDNGIGLTASGVQAYGKSTSDTAAVIADVSNPTGLDLASGGTSEMRIAKAANGTMSSPRLILRNLGISWDGQGERPPIVETFQNQAGRIVISDTGVVSLVALPPHTDTAFYDFASKGVNETQANYANNIYFPRADPVRCPTGQTCRATETDGIVHTVGDWRQGGASNHPDIASATRLHEDGDVHAGDIAGQTAAGVPYPGSKGFRSFSNFTYQYANLTNWISQDTVLISELGGGSKEHNQLRRGSNAFGPVTDAASVPTTGTATYSGYAYGWYVGAKDKEPVNFYGEAKITVNFANRQAQVVLANSLSFDAAATPVPVAFTTYMQAGAAGVNVANYLTGAATVGDMSGGISGRFFGPVANGGPAEMGGVFSTRNATAGTALIGGFIARKP